MIRFLSLAGFLFAAAPAQGQESMTWDQVRSIAESQHEIAILLIEKQQFAKAVEEAKKIFYLPFPKEKERLLVDAAKEVSDALIHHKAHDYALEIYEEGLRSVHSPLLQAELYKEKAYLYKKMGRNEEAMLCFRKAVELEDSGN